MTDRRREANWEYCLLTAYEENSMLTMFERDGARVEQPDESPLDDDAFRDVTTLVARDIARLSAKGWELISKNPIALPGGSSTELFFKRPL
jgi:hypothetical protein